MERIDLADSIKVFDEVLKAGCSGDDSSSSGEVDGGAPAKLEDGDVELVGAGLLALAKQLEEDTDFGKELKKADDLKELKKADAIALLEHLGAMFGATEEDLYEGTFSWRAQEAVRAIQQAAIVERAMASMATVMKSVSDSDVDEGEEEGDESPRGDSDEGWDDDGEDGWE